MDNQQAFDTVKDSTTLAGDLQFHTAGAHITQWAPIAHGQVLFLSSRSNYGVGTAIRGGIPLCFPWFAGGISGAQKPSHGFARITNWRHIKSDELADGEQIEALELTNTDIAKQIADAGNGSEPAVAKQPFRATLMMHLRTNQLEVSLTVENIGTFPYIFEEALHTYFLVGDIHGVSITGLEDACYRDKADDAPSGLQPAAGAALTFSGETDRIYDSHESVQIHDPELGRTITVEKENSDNTVVWNPWSDKGAALKDLGPGEWERFVCVESANIGESAVALQPGESHTLTVRYTVAAR